MGHTRVTKYSNQKKEYLLKIKKNQEYKNKLNNYDLLIKKDFIYIKENISDFENNTSSITCLEKNEFKKTKNRYYGNIDYCRFLRKKIERTTY